MAQCQLHVEKPREGQDGSEIGDKSESTVTGNGQSNGDEEITYPDGGLKAWSVVLGVAFCNAFATFGFVNSFGVFQAYYQETLLPHSSPSNISWIGSIQYGLVFIPSLVTGRLLDLGYFTIPLRINSIGFLVSVFLVAQCKTYWQLLLCQGFAVGIFAGFLFTPAPTCIVHWFNKKRFAAYGFLAAGSSIGGTVIPIITRQLLGRVGYPWTIRLLGFILLLPVAVTNLLLRPRLPPRKVKGGLFNWAGFKNKSYTVYIIAADVSFLGLYVPLTYFDVSAQNAGISPSVSFYFISIANLGSLVGRIASGFLADKYGAMNVLIPFTLLAGIMTYIWPYAQSVGPLVAVAVIYGCASGAFVSLLPSAPSRMGDMGDVGRRIGMMTTLAAAGAMAGPPAAGAILTTSGGFKDVGAYAGSAIVLGCVLLSISRRLALGSWTGVF